jgi:hypothetical protein
MLAVRREAMLQLHTKTISSLRMAFMTPFWCMPEPRGMFLNPEFTHRMLKN